MMRPPTAVRPRQPSQPGKSGTGRARKEATPRTARQTPRQERPERPARAVSGNGGEDALSGTTERPVSSAPSQSRSSRAKDERVNVCVRVRPMSAAEVREGFTEVVDCDLDQPGTIEISRSLRGKENTRKKETFSFDMVLPSSAGQATMYNLLGRPVLDRLEMGYNSCVIAFGATGCGKSHTIFGSDQDRGLLPRISEGIFQDPVTSEAGKQMLVKVSYLELYNEKARDLLKPEDPDNGKAAASLEVREHPKAGIFVEGLTRSVASSAEEVHRLVEFGHKIRVVGSTNMNARSSRSHAIVTLHLQVLDSSGSVARHAQLHAVDLAGAERLFMVGNDSLRRRESMQINKSLLALGQMISKLSKGVDGSHVPYRNSKLTFLLADSLMGNCKTAIIACVSPSSSYQQLTDSTLRFATSVKQIKTKPLQNQELSGDLVQSLRAEVAMLRKRLRQGIYDQGQARELEAQLRGDEYLQDEFTASFEEMQVKAKTAEGMRRRTLRRLGLCNEVEDDAKNGDREATVVQKISLDPLLSGCLAWALMPGDQLRIGSEPDCDIVIDGLGVEAEMCRLVCVESEQIQVLPGTSRPPGEEEGTEGRELRRRGSLYKRGSALVMVNSSVLKEPQILRPGDFLRVGRSHFFRIAPTDSNGSKLSMSPSQAMGVGINGSNKDGHQTASLRDRFGAQKADEVIRDLKELKLVIEEANELTAELRGSDDLSFKGRVLMDPLDDEEDPVVVVSLKMERPEALDASAGSFSYERSGTSAIATWTLAEFQQRLEVMRDIYDEVRLRDQPWGQPGDLDPWHARDSIPVISSKGTPRSSYPGSPAARHSDTPRAVPSPEPCLSTTLLVPAPAPESAERSGDSPGKSRVAMLLQQLPLLQAELAKAHETQGQQATELSSVRRELEELRQSVSSQRLSGASPARRPSDAGNAGNVTPPSEAVLRARHLSVPVIAAGRDAMPKLRSAPRWQGARAPPEAVAGSCGSPSNSQALGTPQSPLKEELALSNLSGVSSVQASEDRSTQPSHISFKMDGISCYAPARSLAESAGCVPFQPQLQPTAPLINSSYGSIHRQFSAPVSRLRSQRTAAPSLSVPGLTSLTTQLRPGVSTVLPVQPVATMTPRAVPPTLTPSMPPALTPPVPYIGCLPPTSGSMLLAPATPRVPPPALVAPPAPAPAPVPAIAQAVQALTARPLVRSDSPSPMENALKVRSTSRMANSTQAPVAPVLASAPSSPRYRAAAEPVTVESLNAMAAAAKAAAQAAPGMNIVVRPVSAAEMALLNERPASARNPGLEVDALDTATRGEQLRSCQVELAGLRKEVDALGQVCRGLTQTFDGSPGQLHLSSPR